MSVLWHNMPISSCGKAPAGWKFGVEIQSRKWRWLDQMLGKSNVAIEKNQWNWTSKGQEKRETLWHLEKREVSSVGRSQDWNEWSNSIGCCLRATEYKSYLWYYLTVYVAARHPGLLALWNDSERRLLTCRWQLFVHSVSSTLDVEKVRGSLPPHMVVPTLILYYLNVSKCQK